MSTNPLHSTGCHAFGWIAGLAALALLSGRALAQEFMTTS